MILKLAQGQCGARLDPSTLETVLCPLDKHQHYNLLRLCIHSFHLEFPSFGLSGLFFPFLRQCIEILHFQD